MAIAITITFISIFIAKVNNLTITKASIARPELVPALAGNPVALPRNLFSLMFRESREGGGQYFTVRTKRGEVVGTESFNKGGGARGSVLNSSAMPWGYLRGRSGA